MANKTSLKDSLSVRVARAQKASERHRIVRMIGGRGAPAQVVNARLYE